MFRSPRAQLLFVAAVCATIAACKGHSDAGTSGATTQAPSVASASAAAPPPPTLPPLTATAPSIAIGNLNAQIESAEKLPWMRVSLVDLLLARGQYLGRIADYERAASIVDGWAKEKPDDPAMLLSRSNVESTFHRFADALADLDAAEKHGAKPEEITPARAGIFAATWRLDDAAALTPKDESTMRTMPLANKGLLAGDMGNYAEEDRLMTLARDKYGDVSPFPLAWLDAQEAKMLERRGKLADARAHYARALTLVPQFATAAAHLAPHVPPNDAIAMLEPLTKTSDDPEVEVQLADALRRAGRADDAATHLKNAEARYDELLKAHPEAFADHAAAMWLGPGKDPARALPLAKANAKNRPTPEAYDLYLAAALGAHDDVEACAAGREATAIKYAPPWLLELAKTAATRCSAKP